MALVHKPDNKPASKLEQLRALGQGQIARRYAIGDAPASAPARVCEACARLRARIVDPEARLARALERNVTAQPVDPVTLPCPVCEERRATQRARTAAHRGKVV